jgi:hypothetical protein
MRSDSFNDLLLEAEQLVSTLNFNLRGDYEEMELLEFSVRGDGSTIAIYWGELQIWTPDNDGPISECKDVLKHRIDKILNRLRELTAEKLFA